MPWQVDVDVWLKWPGFNGVSVHDVIRAIAVDLGHNPGGRHDDVVSDAVAGRGGRDNDVPFAAVKRSVPVKKQLKVKQNNRNLREF